MQVGDLVRIKVDAPFGPELYDGRTAHGIITDVLEGDDGWCHFEVVYGVQGHQEREWFPDLQLEVMNEDD